MDKLQKSEPQPVTSYTAKFEDGSFSYISADAYYIAKASKDAAGRIIKHLWTIFVLLPVVLGILFMLVK